MTTMALSLMAEPRTDTVIMGLGATGLSCARFLGKRGVAFAVTDSRSSPPNAQILLHEFPDIPHAFGRFAEAWITGARRVIVSPGIPLSEPSIQRAMASRVEVVGDIELFARHISAPVIAVTGSNGKSTVTTLVGEMARGSGKEVRVGGNLGPPALDLIGSPEPELYVLELSSFQLETTCSLRPAAAVVLNVTSDHMDRYNSVEDYVAAKRRIYRGAGVGVVNADDVFGRVMAGENRRVLRFTLSPPASDDYGVGLRAGVPWLAQGRTPLMPVSELRIAGRHNAANALAALALGTAIGLPLEAMLETLRLFPGLPHRCQRVAYAHGVEWYNDSKGTNVGATCAAIQGLEGKGKLILIAGGEGKGADFQPLAEVVLGRVKAVIVLGRDAPLLKQALSRVTPVIRAGEMREAVVKAAELANPGDVVLFSPACASFDMFRNYVHRGEAFTTTVQEVVARHAAGS